MPQKSPVPLTGFWILGRSSFLHLVGKHSIITWPYKCKKLLGQSNQSSVGKQWRSKFFSPVLVGRARPCISVAVLLSRIGLRSMWTRLALNYYCTRLGSRAVDGRAWARMSLVWLTSHGGTESLRILHTGNESLCRKPLSCGKSTFRVPHSCLRRKFRRK